MMRGLAQAGTLDLFALRQPAHPDPEPSPIEDMGTMVVCDAVRSRPTSEWLPEWARNGLPRRPIAIDWTEARRELAAWGPRPDLVWYGFVDSWLHTHDLFPGVPAVCDFPDLENTYMRLRRRTPLRFSPGAGVGERARGGTRWLLSRGFDLVDEQRWDKVQRRCADEVDRVVVCSSLDVGRSGCDNAVVIANGAEVPDGVRTDRRDLAGDHPTMLFVGALAYEPNGEAVDWFVREVLPLVRERRPDAVVRIVGRGVERVQWVADVPGVELVGPVESIRPELDRADVSIVPIRMGGGTRLKVLEAMAHHIPMVTTTVGCEGIDLVDGVHAIFADDARSFADGCLRLLSDKELRQKYADDAADLFRARYTWDSIDRSLADLAREVVQERA